MSYKKDHEIAKDSMEEDLEKALNALYIATDASVAKALGEQVRFVVSELKEEIKKRDTIIAKLQGTDVENHIHLDLTNALGADIAGAQMTGMHLNITKSGDRRKTVIESLKNVARQIGANLDHNPEIKITMPCGEVVTYKTFMDVPIVNVACPCGDPNHALIKWGEV